MKTLVICRPAAGVGREQIAPHAAAELAVLRALKDRGVLAEAYSPGGPGAVLVFETGDGEVDKLISLLPLHQQGLIEVEKIQLQPFDL